MSAPSTYAPCKRGCCWVPFEGVCARRRKCRCHEAQTLDDLTPTEDKEDA
jgi:hypothetical protein